MSLPTEQTTERHMNSGGQAFWQQLLLVSHFFFPLGLYLLMRRRSRVIHQEKTVRNSRIAFAASVRA